MSSYPSQADHVPANPSGPITNEAVYALVQALHERLDLLERNLAIARPKETYTAEEAAERLNRKPYTVRQWCNLGQVEGAQKVRGKGRTGEWRIPHDVLVRLQAEGPGPAPGRKQRRGPTRTAS